MKKLTLILLAFTVLLSCKKKENPEPEKKEISYRLDPHILINATMEGSTIVSGCQASNPPEPTVYTGLTNPLMADPGYGAFEPEMYDRGYKAGYNDAMFYQNYYIIAGYPDDCVKGSIVVGIRSAGGSIKYVQPGYVPNSGEHLLGPFMTIGTCGLGSWLKRCVLKNAYESKGLMMQYAFNMNYPGRTQEQMDYDRGRFDGYENGILNDPVSIATD